MSTITQLRDLHGLAERLPSRRHRIFIAPGVVLNGLELESIRLRFDYGALDRLATIALSRQKIMF